MLLYIVGRIRKSFGVKGFVKVEPITHSVQRFEQLKVAYVGRDERNASRLMVEEVNFTQKDVLVKFHNVDNRTNSDELAGQFLFVDEENLLPPPEGSYYVHNILGCAVWRGAEQVGTVVEVYAKTQGFAQDVWVIEGPASVGSKRKRYWLPAVPSLLIEVDIAARRIAVSEIFDFSE